MTVAGKYKPYAFEHQWIVFLWYESNISFSWNALNVLHSHLFSLQQWGDINFQTVFAYLHYKFGSASFQILFSCCMIFIKMNILFELGCNNNIYSYNNVRITILDTLHTEYTTMTSYYLHFFLKKLRNDNCYKIKRANVNYWTKSAQIKMLKYGQLLQN